MKSIGKAIIDKVTEPTTEQLSMKNALIELINVSKELDNYSWQGSRGMSNWQYRFKEAIKNAEGYLK